MEDSLRTLARLIEALEGAEETLDNLQPENIDGVIEFIEAAEAFTNVLLKLAKSPVPSEVNAENVPKNI